MCPFFLLWAIRFAIVCVNRAIFFVMEVAWFQKKQQLFLVWRLRFAIVCISIRSWYDLLYLQTASFECDVWSKTRSLFFCYGNRMFPIEAEMIAGGLWPLKQVAKTFLFVYFVVWAELSGLLSFASAERYFLLWK